MPAFLGIEIDQNLNDLLTSRLEVRGVLVLRVIPALPAAAGLKGALLGADGTFTPATSLRQSTASRSMMCSSCWRAWMISGWRPVSITLLRDGRVMERKVILQGE